MQAAGLYTRKSRKISLTALIDVVFILLMFFMLTSTFNHRLPVPSLTRTSQAC